MRIRVTLVGVVVACLAAACAAPVAWPGGGS
jgi:hypothetical protein